MSERCKFEGCFDDSPCARGERDKAKCEFWSSTENAGATDPAQAQVTEGRVSWNSHALGLRDLYIVAARGRPIVVGIVGPADAGKTTFLVLLYQLLLQGKSLASLPFSGSATLGAWESLAAWMRFTDTPPTFPPHTSSSDRMPGLLHVALRIDDEHLVDVLFTDAPGEWFSRWAIHDAGPVAEGANWVIKNADVLLIFADSERLAGPRKGAARGELQRLIERMGAHARGRPIYLIWGKSDHVVPEALTTAIEATLKRHLPEATALNVRTDAPGTILNAASKAVSASLQRASISIICEPVCAGSPFLAFRGHP